MSVFIIAEAGVNHNGSIVLAKQLIDLASASGADAIKFQTFKAKNLVVKNAPKAEYQKQVTNTTESQFDMIKKLELNEEAHKELLAYCHKKNILFLSSPFDHESIDLLDKLGLKIIKIASGEITNLPFLRHIGSLGKEIILSTGMSNLDEISESLNVLIDSGTHKSKITVLHANTMYPTPMQDVNLNAILTIKEKFSVKVGYSDHTLGIEVGVAAVAMGASCVEKHFTIDKTMDGPDHRASLDPNELKELVRSIRNIEKALGSYEKRPSPSEIVNIDAVRKSIVASKAIKKGDVLSSSNLTVKRPGTGLSPMMWDKVLNHLADRDYEIDELIII